jgi:hypothetical protein
MSFNVMHIICLLGFGLVTGAFLTGWFLTILFYQSEM